MVQIELPRTFIEDCLACESDVGTVIQWKRRTVVLDQTQAQREELVSRANWYTDPYGADAEGLGGLKASARACLRKLGVLA